MWRNDFAIIVLSATHIIFKRGKMGARYLKSEVQIIKKMYATESQEVILALLPKRDWIPICRYARTYLGLHRTRKAIGEAIKIGHEKAIKKKKKGL